MADELSVAEAAAMLGVTADAVRKLAASGELRGAKRGRDWSIDRAAVTDRLRAQPRGGRPLAPATCWGVIFEWSGEPTPAGPDAALLRNARWRGRRWLAEWDIADNASQLRLRAERETFRAHRSQIDQLNDSHHLLFSGTSAAGIAGLVGGSAATVEAYAPFGARANMVRRHGLLEGPGAVTLRWVSEPVWDAISGNFDPHRDPNARHRPAPRAAILLDLLESSDPRARREADRALRR